MYLHAGELLSMFYARLHGIGHAVQRTHIHDISMSVNRKVSAKTFHPNVHCTMYNNINTLDLCLFWCGWERGRDAIENIPTHDVPMEHRIVWGHRKCVHATHYICNSLHYTHIVLHVKQPRLNAYDTRDSLSFGSGAKKRQIACTSCTTPQRESLARVYFT